MALKLSLRVTTAVKIRLSAMGTAEPGNSISPGRAPFGKPLGPDESVAAIGRFACKIVPQKRKPPGLGFAPQVASPPSGLGGLRRRD